MQNDVWEHNAFIRESLAEKNGLQKAGVRGRHRGHLNGKQGKLASWYDWEDVFRTESGETARSALYDVSTAKSVTNSCP